MTCLRLIQREQAHPLGSKRPDFDAVARLSFWLCSPFRAEVYFVNLKVFTSLKRGTKDPVTFEDSSSAGTASRPRAYTLHRPADGFLNSIVGQQALHHRRYRITCATSSSRLNDLLGEKLDSIWTPGITKRLLRISEGVADEFSYSLELIDSSFRSHPKPVGKMIDQRSE
jgi:hypothetical protein